MDNGDNGKGVGTDILNEEARNRAWTQLSAERKPDSPIRRGEQPSGGVLANFQKAIKDVDDYRQELKQGIWKGGAEEVDLICAAIDELKLIGLPLDPVIDRVIANNAGENGARLKAILDAYSHISIGEGEPQGGKQHWWNKISNKNSPSPLSG